MVSNTGEFGSERLVQRVVDTILRQTTPPKTEEEEEEEEGEAARAEAARAEAADSSHASTDASWRSDLASKIILTGHKV